ncbi:MgtE intracellular N domain-containing protein [Cyclonatronum proteinivorum]|uniref:MgtE intracellular N domain-containing protein n=1 Tax=Cyclonatronum proteinivorum TaxID=1457365 RepID=A0A345UN82_9BACT|nr:hypothetical protein [Cyclonatronum proteinivorum]AXJ01934.1 MgtE intracellular N domain-containing protein [Cyclonatronum proteinivorum]
MNTYPFPKGGAAELYDFSNLYELRNACYNLDTEKIIHYANSADTDEVISLLLVLEGEKKRALINGLSVASILDVAEDLHVSELANLLDELDERKRTQIMGQLSDHTLYRLGSMKKLFLKSRTE